VSREIEPRRAMIATNNLLKYLLIISALSLSIPSWTSAASPSEFKLPFWGREKKTIVIDPGHGGDDFGAKGPNGTLEKSVALALAQRIQAELDGPYRVVLTRSDDYGMGVQRRTGLANHQRADLFLSVHTGASLLRDTGGMIFYYFGAPAGAGSEPRQDRGGPTLPWDRLQQAHIAQSRRLVDGLKSRVCDAGTGPRCQVLAAPLLVLEGADMPAVLVEFGHLTHPPDEAMLTDPGALDRLARAVHQGVDDFFQSK
jgi:N-acetylmuramoyl-L-alanine amidase